MSWHIIVELETEPWRSAEEVERVAAKVVKTLDGTQWDGDTGASTRLVEMRLIRQKGDSRDA